MGWIHLNIHLGYLPLAHILELLSENTMMVQGAPIGKLLKKVVWKIIIIILSIIAWLTSGYNLFSTPRTHIFYYLFSYLDFLFKFSFRCLGYSSPNTLTDKSTKIKKVSYVSCDVIRSFFFFFFNVWHSVCAEQSSV